MPTCTATVRLVIGDMKNSRTSLMGSVHYLKALIPITITNTIYNRIQYGPQFFDTHMLNNVPYKILSKHVYKKHPLFNVYLWMRDALRDLEKHYMKQLYFIVRRRDTLDIIEYYCFTVKYPAVGEKPKMKTREQVIQITSELFESINHLGQQDKLNGENISFAMQIILNDSAPELYVTKNFIRSKPFIDPKICDTLSVDENNINEVIEDEDTESTDEEDIAKGL